MGEIGPIGATSVGVTGPAGIDPSSTFNSILLRYTFDTDTAVSSIRTSVPGAVVHEGAGNLNIMYPAGTFPPNVNVTITMGPFDAIGKIADEVTELLETPVAPDGSFSVPNLLGSGSYIMTLSPVFPQLIPT